MTANLQMAGAARHKGQPFGGCGREGTSWTVFLNHSFLSGKRDRRHISVQQLLEIGVYFNDQE